MIAHEADRAAAREESSRDVATFIAHVATLAGEDQGSMALIPRVEELLLAALAGGDDATSAWTMLHLTIASIVEQNQAARDTRVPHAYLQSLVKRT